MTVLAIVAVATGAGCQFNKPNKANIALRKESQTLHEQISTLTAQHEADVAQVRAMQSTNAIPTLPAERLEKLFTTSSLKFKNLVIGDDSDPSKPGDEGFKIAVTPVDQDGDEFKSAGSLKIELFDLAAEPSRIGSWSLTTEEARKQWLSTLVIDGYVVTLPWQTPPAHGKLLVKVTFVEELTGRSFEAKHDLNINPPTVATTLPATQP